MLSDTLRYINLAEVALGMMGLRGPMHLCASVSEERGDEEGAASEVIFFALRFCFHCTQLPTVAYTHFVVHVMRS